MRRRALARRARKGLAMSGSRRYLSLRRLPVLLGLGLTSVVLAPGAASAAGLTTSGQSGLPSQSASVNPVSPSTPERCKNGGWRDYRHFQSEGDCLHFVEGPEITGVSFRGAPADPQITVYGEHFAQRPAADPLGGTSNLGRCGPISGNTGLDYGDELWLDDHTQLWSAGYLPYVDCMGLVVKSYSDDRIVYRLGSFYEIYYSRRTRYSHGIYKLAEGDSVTIHVDDAAFTTQADYDAQRESAVASH